jgi:membrane protease YdiL (CAAX protease family)
VSLPFGFSLAESAQILGALGLALLGIKGSWFLLKALLWGPFSGNAPQKPYRHAISCYLAGIPALFGTSLFIYVLHGGQNPFYFNPEDYNLWLKTSLGFYVLAFVVAPVWEELLFRGFLQGWLSKHPAFGPQRAIVFSAVVFAACHVPGHGWAVALPVFLIGLILGWIRWSAGSLRAAMLVHAIHNMVVTIPYILQSSP